MSLTKVVILIVCVASFAEGKSFFFGCPTPTTKSNFTAPLYLGRWYEQYRYFNTFQIGGRCTTADYSVSGTNNVGVKNTQINWTGTTTTIEGTAYPVNTLSNNGKYIVNFPTAGNAWGNYWVIDTDYVKYAIVWSCRDYTMFNNQELWILTRDKNAGVNDLANYRSIASSRGLTTWPLMSTTQNC